MKKLEITLKGTQPLLMHSDQMVDPLNPFTIEIKKYTGKRKKTIEDYAITAKISFLGALYHNKKDGYYIPGRCVFASILSGGRRTKQGKKVIAALQIIESNAEFTFPDDKLTPEKLFDKPEYVDSRTVVIARAKIIRVRPIFSKWEVKFTAYLDDSELDLDDLKQIIETAGRFEGLGTYRKFYGRFEIKTIKTIQ